MGGANGSLQFWYFTIAPYVNGGHFGPLILRTMRLRLKEVMWQDLKASELTLTF
jgi:hypothetical protein